MVDFQPSRKCFSFDETKKILFCDWINIVYMHDHASLKNCQYVFRRSNINCHCRLIFLQTYKHIVFVVLVCYEVTVWEKSWVSPVLCYDSDKFNSSRSQMFFKISALKNFAIFTGKHLCGSFILTKLQAFRPATLLKKDSHTGVFL